MNGVQDRNQWDLIHRVGHIYNTNPRIPEFLNVVKIFIYFFQIFPILTGICFIKGDNQSSLRNNLDKLSGVILRIDYCPSRIRAISSLCISIISFLIVTINFVYKRLLAVPAFGYYINFLFEFWLPIGFLSIMSVLEEEVENYILHKNNILELVLVSITCIITFVFYLIKTQIGSKPLFIPGSAGGRWNYRPKYYIEILITIFYQLKALRLKYENIAGYINCTIFAIINLLTIYYTFSEKLFRNIDTFCLLSLSIVGFLQCIVQMVFVQYLGTLSLSLTFIDYAVVFIAFIVSFELTASRSFQKFEFKVKENSDSIELSEFSTDDEFLPKDASNKYAVKKLHEMIRYNIPKAISFARYCTKHSEDNNVRVECYRVLALFHELTEQDGNDVCKLSVKDVNIFNRQLLCDLQFEALAVIPDNDSSDYHYNKLRDEMNSLRKTLYNITVAIKLDKKDLLLDEIVKYKKQCSDFEDKASIMVASFPKSVKIANIISDYYHQINFDFSLAQAWSAHTSNIVSDTESNITMSTSDIFSESIIPGKNKSKIAESQLYHRYTSQVLIKAVHSVGFTTSLILSIILTILLLFGSLYTYIPSNFQFLYDRTMVNTTNTISGIMDKTIESYFNFSVDILKSCDPTFNEYINFNYRTPEYGNKDLLDLINELTNNIYYINSNLKNKEDSIKSWSLKPISKEDNYTMHFGEIIASTLILWQYDNTCSARTSSYINLFIEHFKDTFPPLYNIQMELIELTTKSFESYKITYFIYCGFVTFIITAIVIALFYLLHVRKDTEIERFIEAFRTINPKTMSEIQSMLVHGQPLIITNNKSEYYVDSESISSTEERSMSENLEDACYAPIEDTEMDTDVKRNCFISDNKIVAALLFIAFTIPFNTILCSYYFPFVKFIKMGVNLDLVTSSCMTIISSMQIYATSCGVETINNLANTTGNVENISLILVNFTKSIKDNLYGDYKNKYKNAEGVKVYEDMYNDIFKEFNSIFLSLSTMVPLCMERAKNDVVDHETIRTTFELAFINYAHTIERIRNAHNENVYKSEELNKLYFTVFSVIMTAISILFFITLVIKLFYYSQEFNGLKKIMLVLAGTLSEPITHLTSSFNIKNMNNTYELHKNVLSRNIIKQSMNAIIIVDSKLDIQDINSSACQLLQQRKDSIIKKNLSDIIHNPKDKSIFEQQYVSLYNRLDVYNTESDQDPDIDHETEFNILIRYGNINSIKAFKAVSCRVVPLNCIEVWGDAMSFAFIMRDQSEFFSKERELKDAQIKVESLLNRIMPKVIASRLLSKGDKQNRKITSKVDKATIIFIGIHNFTEWCSNKTHKEIMTLLDVIFSKFDNIIAKYQTLVKIKTINGVYMVAGGLFNEISERTPVHEAVEFCLECAKWVERRNEVENKNLKLHIGINYDGPIISGVLGFDKPLFDIWGDAVNVSARLETSSIPDTIQMSQDTYEALPRNHYDIKMREGVFLKGKGNVNTYYIDFAERRDAEESEDNF